MTTPPLSPAAQAVFDAYENAHDGEYIDGEWIPDERAMVAAAIRASVEQTLPDEGDRWRQDMRGDAWRQWEQRQETRAELLAIAAELDGGNTTTETPMTDPTPTAPDWRELCRELRDAYFSCEDHPGNDPRSIELIARADAALATTREAAPGAEISYEDLDDLCSKFSFFTDDDESRDLLFEMLRAVWSRAQAARPAIQPVPQLPPEQEFALRLYQLLQRFDAELFYTNNDDGVHFSVGTSKPFSGFCGLSELRDQLIEAGLLPAADQQEGRDAAAREPQP